MSFRKVMADEIVCSIGPSIFRARARSKSEFGSGFDFFGNCGSVLGASTDMLPADGIPGLFDKTATVASVLGQTDRPSKTNEAIKQRLAAICLCLLSSIQ